MPRKVVCSGDVPEIPEFRKKKGLCSHTKELTIKTPAVLNGMTAQKTQVFCYDCGELIREFTVVL